MTTKQKLTALIKREVLDGKGGLIYTPAVVFTLLVGLLLISVLLGNDPVEYKDFVDPKVASEKWESLSDNTREVTQYIFSGLYWMTSAPLWIAFPFVVFFGILGTLYEDRRDKSILFWKSMPVSDAQEVLAKFFTSTMVAALIFFVTAIAIQLSFAIVSSIYFGIKGLPISMVWPVAEMIEGWSRVLPLMFLIMLWSLPVFAWLLLVSAYAPRMPFMYAVVPVVVLGVMEAVIFNSSHFMETVGHYIAGGLLESAEAAAEPLKAYEKMNLDMKNPEDAAIILEAIQKFSVTDMYIYTVTQVKFWAGIIVAGGFTYGAIELRKRAS